MRPGRPRASGGTSAPSPCCDQTRSHRAGRVSFYVRASRTSRHPGTTASPATAALAEVRRCPCCLVRRHLRDPGGPPRSCHWACFWSLLRHLRRKGTASRRRRSSWDVSKCPFYSGPCSMRPPPPTQGCPHGCRCAARPAPPCCTTTSWCTSTRPVRASAGPADRWAGPSRTTRRPMRCRRRICAVRRSLGQLGARAPALDGMT